MQNSTNLTNFRSSQNLSQNLSPFLFSSATNKNFVGNGSTADCVLMSGLYDEYLINSKVSKCVLELLKDQQYIQLTI